MFRPLALRDKIEFEKKIYCYMMSPKQAKIIG